MITFGSVCLGLLMAVALMAKVWWFTAAVRQYRLARRVGILPVGTRLEYQPPAEYRPYLWLGEDLDAHVVDWKRTVLEVTRAKVMNQIKVAHMPYTQLTPTA
jgi:hypothetical protein